MISLTEPWYFPPYTQKREGGENMTIMMLNTSKFWFFDVADTDTGHSSEAQVIELCRYCSSIGRYQY